MNPKIKTHETFCFDLIETNLALKLLELRMTEFIRLTEY